MNESFLVVSFLSVIVSDPLAIGSCLLMMYLLKINQPEAAFAVFNLIEHIFIRYPVCNLPVHPLLVYNWRHGYIYDTVSSYLKRSNFIQTLVVYGFLYEMGMYSTLTALIVVKLISSLMYIFTVPLVVWQYYQQLRRAMFESPPPPPPPVDVPEWRDPTEITVNLDDYDIIMFEKWQEDDHAFMLNDNPQHLIREENIAEIVRYGLNPLTRQVLISVTPVLIKIISD